MDNLVLLHYLAVGLNELKKRFTDKGNMYPYPENLQKALNGLAALFVKKKLSPPANIIDLINLSRQSIVNWGIYDDDELMKLNPGPLLEENELTEFGMELVYSNSNISEEYEQKLLVDVLNFCRIKDDQSGYVEFRSTIISNPYISSDELTSYFIKPEFEYLADYLKDAYEKVPPSSAKSDDGELLSCGYCNWILEKDLDGKLSCISKHCYEETGFFNQYQKIRKDTGKIFRLKKGVMRYIAYPGIYELKLAEELGKIDELRVELWPEFDKYDLRIVFPTGKIWVVDVKDWHSPMLLAKNMDSFQEQEGLDKAFYVIPNYRIKKFPRYLNILEESWTGKNNSNKALVSFKNYSDFIKEVKKECLR